jgi:signal transduction histidine kinase
MKASDMLSATNKSPRWLIGLVLAVMALEIATLVVLVMLNQLALRRLFEEFILFALVVIVSMTGVGVLIVYHRPGNAIGWLLCAAGIGMGVSACVHQYTRYALVTRGGDLLGGEIAAWLTFWIWIPVISLLIVILPLLFPHGRLPSPRWRPVGVLAVVSTLLMMLNLAVTPGPIDESLAEVMNPITSPATLALYRVINPVAGVMMLLSIAAAVAAPIARMRHAQGMERDQLKWFAFAAVIVAVGFLIPIVVGWPNFTEDTFLSGLLHVFTVPCVPIAVGIAILRHRLYAIDLIINRALVYGLLTLLLVGLYIGTVTGLGALLSAQGKLAISLVGTGLVTMVFQPLYLWLQRSINRLLYGDREEPYTVISRLGQRLEATLMPQTVLPTIVATVRDALKLPYTAMTIQRGGSFVIVAEEGTPPGETLPLPLVYQGETVGQLIVSARAQGDVWTLDERRLLDDLARHAGVAVHGVRVMTELMQARERLVLAREEERRRLRRDLHDDLAPSLAALALTASTAQDMIISQPEKAAAILRELTTALRTTVGDVRRLAYDLRPPTLDELGLTEAIYEVAARWNSGQNGPTGNGTHIMVEIPEPLPALPAAVEVAAYRIIQEAFMNVQRHAKARVCVARLTCVEQRMLQCEITDDGAGMPEKMGYGLGLHSMQERAVELGGSFEIAPALSHGTRIIARLPISTEFVSETSADGTTISHPDRR